MTILPTKYLAAAEMLKRRILDLIPSNHAILDMKSPEELRTIKGLKYDDINPSFAMVQVSLEAAQDEWRGRPKKKG
jgi:hypothetical protein